MFIVYSSSEKYLIFRQRQFIWSYCLVLIPCCFVCQPTVKVYIKLVFSFFDSLQSGLTYSFYITLALQAHQKQKYSYNLILVLIGTLERVTSSD